MDEKKLLMTFKNVLGNSFSITVYDPKEDIKEKEIIDTMDLILKKRIFQPKGYELATCVGAKVIQSNTTEFDLKL